MRYRLSAFCIILLALVFCSVRCGIRGFKDNPYRIPRLVLVTPDSPASSPVEISFNLIDPGFRSCALSAEYSLDGNSNWITCVPAAGSDNTNLASSLPPGTQHSFSWDATANQFTSAGKYVYVRLQPSAGGDTGEGDTTDRIFVTGTWTGTGTSTGISAPIIYSATWMDMDANETVSDSDEIELVFGEPVTGTVSISDFSLPVSGDLFGSGASAAILADGTIDITLGSGPQLLVNGFFLPSATSPGSPSGLTVNAGSGILGCVTGLPAPARTVDIRSGLPGEPGSLVWAKHIYGVQAHAQLRALMMTKDGNPFFCGNECLDIIFADGEANETMLTGEVNFFCKYYEGNGMLIYAAPSNVNVTAVCSPVDAGACAVGPFFETTTFGAGEPAETTLIPVGGNDIFVAKYHMDGSLIWVRQAGGPGFDMPFCITEDTDNNFIVAGINLDNCTFGPGEPGEVTLAGTTVFIAKYDRDGTLLWAKGMCDEASSGAFGVAAAPGGDSIVAGFFLGSATFGEGAGQVILVSEGWLDAFVARYDTSGNLVWVRQIGSADEEACFYLSTLPDGTSLVTGHFCNGATFSLGEADSVVMSSYGGGDIFVARYEPDGALTWVKKAGSVDNEQSMSIAASADGISFITGFFGEPTAIFGEGEGNETILTNGGFGGSPTTDVFIAKYNSDGTLAWAKRAGSDVSDQGMAVALTPDGSPIIVGHYDSAFAGGAAVFGEGEPNETILPAVNPDTGVFIAKFRK